MRMLSELKNAPEWLLRAVDVLLSKTKSRSAVVYLDGIVVRPKSVTEHLVHLRNVLTLLQNPGVALKLPKCSFFDDTLSNLGHTV